MKNTGYNHTTIKILVISSSNNIAPYLVKPPLFRQIKNGNITNTDCITKVNIGSGPFIVYYYLNVPLRQRIYENLT